MGPPAAASGLTCPMHAPRVAPLKRPSVMSATESPSPRPTMALVGSSIYTAMSGTAGVALEWWQGGLVLAAIAAVTTLIGFATSWRRDVS